MKLLFNGHPWPKNVKPQDLNWASCWHDDGPSPAGNTGFYLHVPHISDGTTHRIYFVEVGKAAERDMVLREAILPWMPIIRVDAQASHLMDGFNIKRNRLDEMLERLNAALAATEPKEVK